jgi:hypothetical protein
MSNDSFMPMPRFSLKTLAGIVFVAALLSLFAAYQRDHQRAYRAYGHINHLKELSLALINYEQRYERFPPSTFVNDAGTPVCSWRPKILEYGITSWRYNDTFAWNAPENVPMGPAFCHYLVWDDDALAGNELDINAVGITGPDAAFDAARTSRLEIGDPARDLIILIEVRNSGIHWMEPGDLDYRELIARERSGKLTLGVMDGSFCVAFVNGRVLRLRSDTPRELLLKFMTVDGANAHDAEELFEPYRR